jgi:glycerophosphoryl diester phosphodiesterase
MALTLSQPDNSSPVPPPARTLLGRLALWSEALVVVFAFGVIACCLAILWILVLDPRQGETWTSGLRPATFTGDLDADLLEDYADTFVVGHNSGDTVLSTLEAIGSGADVIEVDVISLNGKLYAAHDSPNSWVGDRLFRGPPLERIWLATGGVSAIKLDLKESSPAFTQLVLDFLEERRGQRRVVVVSGNTDLLYRFATEQPEVFRLLSVSNDKRFDQVLGDPALIEMLDGISVNHSLLDEERVARAKDNDLLIFAWTVNSLERVNELVIMGVDAITTDNLAIMKLLGNRLGRETALERMDEPPAPSESFVQSAQ